MAVLVTESVQWLVVRLKTKVWRCLNFLALAFCFHPFLKKPRHRKRIYLYAWYCKWYMVPGTWYNQVGVPAWYQVRTISTS